MNLFQSILANFIFVMHPTQLIQKAKEGTPFKQRMKYHKKGQHHNEARNFWIKCLINNLPRTNCGNIFREVFALENLPFSWAFFESANTLPRFWIKKGRLNFIMISLKSLKINS